MTAFKRGNKWAAKFVLDGKQFWVPGGPWEKKSHAQEAEKRMRDRLAYRRTDETCASFGERWLEEWPRPEASTRKLYAQAVRRFSEYFGATPLGDVEKLSARTWGLTVPRRVSGVIRTMYADALAVGLVETNPFSDLRLPMGERKAQIVPPTLEQYSDLLNACTILGGYGPEFKAMIQFAAWTGVRQGELFALMREDVGEEEVFVHRSRKLDGTIGLPKNGTARTIPLVAPARVLNQVPTRPDGFLFHSPQGHPLLKGTHAWSWNKVKASAGVSCRWHDLRHFCATQLLEMGLSHFDVSVQLGHTDGGKLVMERYGHPSEAAAKRRLLAAFEIPDHLAGSQIGSREAI